MPAKINLINQQFGKLTVKEETSERKNKSVVWICECECGNREKFSTKELRSDGIIQCSKCGKSRKPNFNLTENIVGKKYNHLKVKERTNKTQGDKLLYACECDCGNPKLVYVTRTDLISGHTKSCGCLKRKYSIGNIINNRKIIDIIGKKEDKRDGNFYYKCKCLLCGREYDALAQTLDNTISCGCQKSIGEYNIIQILNKNNISYIKEFIIDNSNYRFDFAILNSANNVIRLIEFDGEQHYEENVKNSGWNTLKKYEYTYKNDIAKNNLAKEKEIPLVRIPYWERDNITLEMILSDKYLIS